MSQGHIASAECGLASSNARLTVMLWNFHTASKKACASKSTKVKLGGGAKESREFCWRIHLVEATDHAKCGVRVVAELVRNRRYMAV